MFENSYNSIALPVPLLRQVYVGLFLGTFFGVLFRPLFSSPFFASWPPLDPNMAGSGGQLGPQKGPKIDVFEGPRGILS